MSTRGEADTAAVAALMADPSRATVLTELADGRALPPSELAEVAGVSRSTMSGHLGKLERAGLLGVERGGRNRYYRLAGPEVAAAVEALSALAPRRPVRSLRAANRAGALATARTCYGHLAGRLGVEIADALTARGLVEREADVILLSDEGHLWMTAIGVAKPPRAGKACNDWSERRTHIGGRLGVALAKRLFDADWVRRTSRRRGVELTPLGKTELREQLGIR